MKKFMVLTGKRGGYGAMKPMLRFIQEDPDIDLQLVVTDQHLNSKFGRTINEIEKDFEITAKVEMMQKDGCAISRSQALGNFIVGMSLVIEKHSPDILLLYGDRGEGIAAAIAATTMGIPIAHIQGGDVSGSVDEQFRHATTKLAQIHFPSTENSAQRIKNLGEEDWRIHVVGDNHIDEILAGNYLKPFEVIKKLSLNLQSPIIVVLQHSETTDPSASYNQMIETLSAVNQMDTQTVVVYPCSDVGYEGIISAIKQYEDLEKFQVHINLDASLFWGLLNIATVLVGNSSAGIVETPSFHIPVINIGRRQEGRLHAENVIHVAHNRKKIKEALEVAINDASFHSLVHNCTQPYGNGTAGKKITKILKETYIDKRLMTKKITY